MTFRANAGKPYHLWIRMRAENDASSNDSVHIQFDDAVDALGASYAAMATSSSAELVLQDGPNGAADRAWGWTDNGWGAQGPNVYFRTTGEQTIRVQQREDGAIIDQIVLSPDAYLSSAPGARRSDTVILPRNDGTT